MPQQKQASSASAPGAAGTASAAQSYWRSFPALEKLLSQEDPPLLEQLRATCRQLDAIAQTGSPQEKARAREAMAGYARALELYRELVDRREHAMAEASNIGKTSHEKSGRGEQQ
jgi:hypothetical protein